MLPHTTKLPADSPPGELAIFQTEHLHLQNGFAIEGTLEEWCEQIAAPFQWKFTREDLHKLLAKTDAQPTSLAA